MEDEYDQFDVFCLYFSKEEFLYLKGVIDGLIELQKHIPKKLQTEKSQILFQIKEKYFT